MTFWKNIKFLIFGEGAPIPERTPEPVGRSEIYMAYAGAVFLIAVATYIPMNVFENRTYYEGRHRAVFETCVLQTKDFAWCWHNLGP